ncbi:hypothetical protein EXM99_08260 [Clostridium botulinum]|nr:hypothetical protein [Clostridium botulinum]NFF13759.1 hypothetical protein [Clostridium botulinum]
MSQEKDKHINAYDYGDDFMCPDCGGTSKDGKYDAGNGFCQDCAPNH